MTGEPIARVTNVSHRYGSTVSLDNVSIDIPARIMVGVIGPDGVGKSTLLALIAGVRKIQQGEVVVFDKNVGNPRNLKEIRGRIAYMPQGLGRNLYPTLSVFENIDFSTTNPVLMSETAPNPSEGAPAKKERVPFNSRPVSPVLAKTTGEPSGRILRTGRFAVERNTHSQSPSSLLPRRGAN